ncbi:MAG: thiol:disulfide interchange protein DsbA/DsbL [Gammaproteobacteria bacterium]|nr:MAG: thiol:disulfide interchange protein DsbA/DsbL [Gammaproteobacteria bacterium]
MRALLLPLLFVCLLAEAAPYTEVEPHPGDAHRVYLFFAFHCPFCRERHALFERWGESLPEPFVFEAVPVLALKEDIPLARAYYAASMADPEKLPLFVELLYEAVIEHGLSPDEEALFGLAREAGIPGEAFSTAWKSREGMEKLIRARYLLESYPVTSTPALAIAGRYVLSPEHTRGDYGLFFKVANGLISMILEGGKP